MNENGRIKLNIAVCDDEPAMLERIRQTCETVLADDFEIHIETAQSAKELLRKDEPIQIAVLDVQLPEQDGIDLARELLSRDERCRIIFVSGFLNMVSDVYDVPHFGFVLKEQMDMTLPKFLKRAAMLAEEDAGKRLSISTGKQTEEVLLRELVMMERRGHKTFCTLLDGSVIQCREKLPDLLKRIASTRFVRCHISYAVNLAYVKREEDKGFRLKTGQWVPISLPNRQSAREAFWQHMTEEI